MAKKKKAEKSDLNMESVEEKVEQIEEKSEQIAESKAQKFVRLAEKRVSRSLKDMVSIGKLASKNNYVYTEEQIKQIIDALKLQLSKLEVKFSNATVEKPAFQF